MRREYTRGGPTAKAFVTGDHGAVSKQDMVMTKKIEEQDFLEWDSSW